MYYYTICLFQAPNAAEGDLLMNTVIILLHAQDKNLWCFDNPLSAYKE